MIENNNLFMDYSLKFNVSTSSELIETNLYEQWLTAAPFVLSIGFVTIALLLIFGYYKYSMSRLHPDECPSGVVLILFFIINYFRNMTRDLLGDSFEKMTPLFIALFFYILISNLIGMFELSPPTASVTVTISLGLVSWIGTQVIGIRYQKWNYLKSMFVSITVKNKKGKKIKIPIIPDPIHVLGKITPLISISLRLWGNIFAGALIISLIYNIPFLFQGVDVFGGLISEKLVIDSPLVVISSLFSPPIHLYLDVMTGTIQAYVFVILTMVYWTMEKNEQ